MFSIFRQTYNHFWVLCAHITYSETINPMAISAKYKHILTYLDLFMYITKSTSLNIDIFLFISSKKKTSSKKFVRFGILGS